MRILRLAMGIFIVVQGFIYREWMFVLMGGLFSLMPLLNVGCCTTGNCAIPPTKNDKKQQDEIHYEEIK